MGKMDNLLFGMYNSMATYSKIAVFLLSIFGFLGVAYSYAAPPACIAAPGGFIEAAGGGSCGPVTSATNPSASCTTIGCPAATAFGCGATGGVQNYQCTTTANVVAFPLCSIYNDIHNIIFLLGLVLVILGGALYAGSHVMPAQTRGQIQGYGMGFILGGVIGVIISLLAPFIISTVSGQASTTILSVCTS